MSGLRPIKTYTGNSEDYSWITAKKQPRTINNKKERTWWEKLEKFIPYSVMSNISYESFSQESKTKYSYGFKNKDIWQDVTANINNYSKNIIRTNYKALANIELIPSWWGVQLYGVGQVDFIQEKQFVDRNVPCDGDQIPDPEGKKTYKRKYDTENFYGGLNSYFRLRTGQNFNIGPAAFTLNKAGCSLNFEYQNYKELLPPQFDHVPEADKIDLSEDDITNDQIKFSSNLVVDISPKVNSKDTSEDCLHFNLGLGADWIYASHSDVVTNDSELKEDGTTKPVYSWPGKYYESEFAFRGQLSVDYKYRMDDIGLNVLASAGYRPIYRTNNYLTSHPDIKFVYQQVWDNFFPLSIGLEYPNWGLSGNINALMKLPTRVYGKDAKRRVLNEEKYNYFLNSIALQLNLKRGKYEVELSGGLKTGVLPGYSKIEIERPDTRSSSETITTGKPFQPFVNFFIKRQIEWRR